VIAAASFLRVILEFLAKPSLLEHLVGRMARLDFAVDCDVTLGDRAVPDFVITLSGANELTVVLPEMLANLTLVYPSISAMVDWGRA
jgi:hypothetical protein